jgi:peptidoglycan hydrolase-like protein with peptidoglycan-binding domain
MASNEIYESMIQARGIAYRESQIKPYSHYNDPIDRTPGRPAGNSHVWGDASPEVQSRVIDALISASEEAGLGPRETAQVLAIARVESGFNPDAAAGTTSAHGLGQFVDATGRHYGINDGNRASLDKQAEALVAHYRDNATLARSRGQGDEFIYKYHHDGPTKEYGGLGISQREVMPYVDRYEQFVRQHQQRRHFEPPGDAPRHGEPVRTHPSAPAQPGDRDLVLAMGASGDGVVEMQRKLNAVRGTTPRLEEDGHYGLRTREGLEEFQRNAGLEMDGAYGPRTRTALESAHRVLTAEDRGIHRLGDQGGEIGDAQRALGLLGYRGKDGAPLVPDGDFGPNTEHAVRKLQQDHGLPVDGVIGARTWSALREAYGQRLTHGAEAPPVAEAPKTPTPARQPGSFNDAMLAMLPPQDGKAPHITSHAGKRTLNGREDLHEGVDFNYAGGQTGINLKHPTVYAPVSGTVIGVASGKGSYGTIRIRDEHGYEHRILHTDSQLVEQGQQVLAGRTPIGTMGGRGPGGSNQYPQHVDYRIKDPQGHWINPEKHWNDGIDVPIGRTSRLEGSDTLRAAFARIGEPGPLHPALDGTQAALGYEAQKAGFRAMIGPEAVADAATVKPTDLHPPATIPGDQGRAV